MITTTSITINNQKEDLGKCLCQKISLTLLCATFLFIILTKIGVFLVYKQIDSNILPLIKFPYCIMYAILPLAYLLAKKGYTIANILYLLIYVLTVPYLLLALKDIGWIMTYYEFHAYSSTTITNIIQTGLLLLFPSYLLFYGILLWKLFHNMDIKHYYKNCTIKRKQHL